MPPKGKKSAMTASPGVEEAPVPAAATDESPRLNEAWHNFFLKTIFSIMLWQGLLPRSSDRAVHHWEQAAEQVCHSTRNTSSTKSCIRNRKRTHWPHWGWSACRRCVTYITGYCRPGRPHGEAADCLCQGSCNANWHQRSYLGTPAHKREGQVGRQSNDTHWL